MRHWSNIAFGLFIVFIIALGLWEYQWDLKALEDGIRAEPLLGALLYITLLIASVVLLPFSSLPLLPLAARIFGVWMTGVLSIIGWWLGCLIAFQIARLGRSVLERFVSFAVVDRLERRIPPDINFAGIVMLRMILPVDLTSFALGLLKNLRFSTYAVASLLGIMPFAFVWSYAGGEIGRGEILPGIAILLVLLLTVMMLRRKWLR
ncbi:TVP38/TMEM64 family protein [Candidatus Peregrinibacteria bacterium]|nr:TVP38/TMEM64 family protein [Candidatus Peregrinibacteria bacterium]